jgi:hypothetical protein
VAPMMYPAQIRAVVLQTWDRAHTVSQCVDTADPTQISWLWSTTWRARRTDCQMRHTVLAQCLVVRMGS